MAKKNRPYRDSTNRNRTLPKQATKRFNRISDSRQNPSKEKKETDVTTKIRIDKIRLNDSESLDTSFLEGRFKKKVRNNRTEKEKILKEKKDYSHAVEIAKKIFYLLGILCLVLLVILVLANSHLFEKKKVTKKDSIELKDISNNDRIVDKNYVFVGDQYIDQLDFSSLDYHYVKVCDSKWKTQDIVDHLKKNIYDYNPSYLFLEIGMNDLIDEEEKSVVLDHITEIIEKVQENRPYAKIYIESLYPINKDIEDFDSKDFKKIENKDIMEFNKKLESLCKSLNVQYLDLFQELSIDNQLNEKYTEDGITLDSEGNKKVLKVIQNILDDHS